ncbi:hypothetical protein THIX_110045 [Thiomonas sp. X19]|nr:hypothetical protein THIX_110045 [Thiomonas sp. X19]
MSNTETVDRIPESVSSGMRNFHKLLMHNGLFDKMTPLSSHPAGERSGVWHGVWISRQATRL